MENNDVDIKLDSGVSSDNQQVFQDVLEVEESKDYFNIEHYKKKAPVNSKLSVNDRINISSYIAKKHPFTKINNTVDKLLDFSPNETDDKVISELNGDGFHVLENRISEGLCDDIAKKLESVPYRIRGFKKKLYGINESNISKYRANAIWAINQNDIYKIPEVQKIAFDENLLNIIGGFLGSDPILCSTTSWWSKSHSSHRSNLSGNAQLFHQDVDYLKFIKVFIYLNDIEEKNGPHQYVKGSAKTAEDKLGEEYRTSSRVEDDRVKEIFGEENIKTFTGKKGTIIIEDTLGLHKGTSVKEGSRLLVQLVYTNSLYFHSSQHFDPSISLPEVKEFCQKRPRVFSNFTNKAAEINRKKIEIGSKMTLKQYIVARVRKYI